MFLGVKVRCRIDDTARERKRRLMAYEILSGCQEEGLTLTETELVIEDAKRLLEETKYHAQWETLTQIPDDIQNNFKNPPAMKQQEG